MTAPPSCQLFALLPDPSRFSRVSRTITPPLNSPRRLCNNPGLSIAVWRRVTAHWEAEVERARHQAVVDARAARTMHARDVAQNAELLGQLTALRKEVTSSHPNIASVFVPRKWTMHLLRIMMAMYTWN